MTHDHHHHHGHHHGAARADNRFRLACTLGLTLLYMVAEIVGGYMADSLSLLADAGHMFSDAAGLGLSLFAAWIAGRPPTPQHSYGYYRAEILAALANGAMLIAISILILIEAVHRISAPEEVIGSLMAAIAAGGLLVNIVGLLILNAGKGESLNMRGAWLHLISDALGSAAALIAGGLVWAFRWEWADPVTSILIAVLVVFSAWGLVKQAIAILMESTPAHLNVDAVREAMLSAAGVVEVHDLHIWTITSGMDSLSAHVVLAPGFDGQSALDSLRTILHDRFAIDHITIQVDAAGQSECRSSFS